MPSFLDQVPTISLIEAPDLETKYSTVDKTFLIRLAIASPVLIVVCALTMYFSTLKDEMFVFTLPAAVAVALAAGAVGALVWTYLQQRAWLDLQQTEHTSDREAARGLARRAVEINYTLVHQQVNVNSGQQAFFPGATGSSEPRVYSGGKELRDYWQGADTKTVLELPSPEKKEFVLDWLDVDKLVEYMLEFGETRRETEGRPLPSGRAVYSGIWSAVVFVMREAGIVSGIPKSPTKFLQRDAGQIKAQLRKARPDGIVVTPAKTKEHKSPLQTTTSSPALPYPEEYIEQ